MSSTIDRLSELQNRSYNFYGINENIQIRTRVLTNEENDLEIQVNNFLNMIIPIKEKVLKLKQHLDDLKHVYNSIVNPGVHDDELELRERSVSLSDRIHENASSINKNLKKVKIDIDNDYRQGK